MRSSPKSRATSAAVGCLLLVAMTACRLEFIQMEDEHIGAGVRVSNGSSKDLRLEALGDGEWLWLGDVGANSAGSISARNWYSEHSRIAQDGCTTGPVRALDQAEEEVAFREEPLCDGDTWVIELTER